MDGSMIKVDPMPNELAIAHEGRMGWVNGCMSPTELNAVLKQAIISRGCEPAGMPKLHQLALVSNMTCTDYARQHSMLPVLRVAAKVNVEVLHGSESGGNYSRRLGMLTQRRGAYCCVDCIKDDLEFWHFSWFRRTHQMIGVDWCSLHGTVLSQVDDPNPFRCVPHKWRDDSKLSTLKPCVDLLPTDGFLRRYVDISAALLERDRPLPVAAANGRLALRARALGLRTSRSGQRPLISDELCKQVPALWLHQNLPNWAEKTPNSYFQRIDALAASRGIPVGGEVYVMVMAALYESTEDALSDLTRPETAANVPEKVVHRKREKSFWHGEIWTHYLACRGQLNEMSKSLQIDKKHLGEMMAAVGLPSLHDLEHSKTWRAFMRFGAGQGLSKSCAAEQIAVEDLEPLLLKCSARVLAALKKVSATQVGREVGLPMTEKGGTVSVFASASGQQDPSKEASRLIRKPQAALPKTAPGLELLRERA